MKRIMVLALGLVVCGQVKALLGDEWDDWKDHNVVFDHKPKKESIFDVWVFDMASNGKFCVDENELAKEQKKLAILKSLQKEDKMSPHASMKMGWQEQIKTDEFKATLARKEAYVAFLAARDDAIKKDPRVTDAYAAYQKICDEQQKS